MAEAPADDKAGAEPHPVYVATPRPLPPPLSRLARRVDPGEACSVEGVVVVPPGRAPGCPPGSPAVVVEGPPSLEALADYLEYYGASWSPRSPPWADPALRARLALHLAREMRARAPRPPGRPPPVLVASEYYAAAGLGEALRRLGEGADYVVVGARDPGEAREALSQVRRLAPAHGGSVGFDYWDTGLQAAAVEAGASLVLSLTGSMLGGVPARARGRAWFVLVPEDPRAPAESRVEDLCGAVSRARRLGYQRVIVDPVLNPPVNPGALEGLAAARGLAARCPRGVPVMLGIHNVYELLDADTQGSIALLAALAAEAGASLLLVGEESWKARGATLEARVAADMASLALRWRVPPKDVGFTLLPWKGKRPPSHA